MTGAIKGIDPHTRRHFEWNQTLCRPGQGSVGGRPLQDLRRQRAPRLSAARRTARPPRPRTAKTAL